MSLHPAHNLKSVLLLAVFALASFASLPQIASAATFFNGLTKYDGGYLNYLYCYAGAPFGTNYNNATGRPACPQVSGYRQDPGNDWRIQKFLYPPQTAAVNVGILSVYQGGTGYTRLLTYRAVGPPVCNSGNQVDYYDGDGNPACAGTPSWPTCSYYGGDAHIGDIEALPGGWNGCVRDDVTTYGGQPTFAAGSPVTVEWSCQPYMDYLLTVCDGGSSGCRGSHEQYSGPQYIYQNAPAGTGFSTNGQYSGITTATAASSYALTCSGVDGNAPPVTLPVTIDNCPTLGWQPWQSNSYLLEPGATRRINAVGHNFCVTNNGGQYVYIPANSEPELASFINTGGGGNASVF